MIPLGEIISDLQVVQCSKKIGLLVADSSKDYVDASGRTDEDRQDGLKGKKADEADLKAKRQRDELVVAAFVHKSSLVDKDNNDEKVKSEDLEKQYKVGKDVSCRVVGHHLVEGWVLATTMGSLEEGESIATHSSQITAGQLLDVKIASINNFGLVVQIGEKLKGVCPAMHVSDSTTGQNLNKRFKLGQKLQMRVWEIDGNKILLTNKKSLIECDESICITKPSDATKGLATMGVVSKISELGIQVHFFNLIKGLVPMSVLVKQGVTDPDDAFRVGQIVKCVVLSLTYPNEYKGKQKRKAKPRILLSLDLGMNQESLIDDEVVPSSSSSSDKESSSVCTYVSGSVIKSSSDHVNVRLDDGRLATIDRVHLCDTSKTSSAFIALPHFQPGQRVENSIVLSDGKGGLMLTRKPLLLSAAKSELVHKKSVSDSVESDDICFPSSISHMLPGQMLAGYVFKVESYGVLVRFKNSLTALAPRPNIGDKFTATPVGLFNIGDSVRCLVQRVDLEKDRIVVTLKPALITPSSGSQCYLTSLLRENFVLYSSIKENKSLVIWKDNKIGTVIDATVTAVKDYGVVLLSHDSTTVMLAQGSHAVSSSKIGVKVKVRVLDMDFDKNIMNVSMHKSVLSSAKSKTDEKLVPEIGGIVEGKILLVKEKYLVVSFGKSAMIGYVMIADYHSPYLNTSEYQVNGELILKYIGESTSSGRNNEEDGSHDKEDYPHVSLPIFTLHDENRDGRKKGMIKLQREADEADSTLQDKLMQGNNSKPVPTTEDAEVLRQKLLGSLRVGGKHCWVVKSVHPTHVSFVPEHNDIMDLKVTASAHVSCSIDAFDGK